MELQRRSQLQLVIIIPSRWRCEVRGDDELGSTSCLPPQIGEFRALGKMQKSSIRKSAIVVNAVTTSVQVAVNGVLFFVLYRFLLDSIGVKNVGVWSLVLAIASINNVAAFGMEGSVVIFVAAYAARNDHSAVVAVIQTAVIFVALAMAVALFIGQHATKWLLALVIGDDSLPLAISILPLVLLSIWLATVKGIFHGAINGFQRFYITRIILIGEALSNLLLCFLFVPAYRLEGVAYAALIANLLAFMLSWLVLRKLVRLPVVPYRWSTMAFREIREYGMKFQIISIVVTAYEPITKAFLSAFGGLSMVGYYSMAARMVQQFRLLVVSAVEVIVPVISNLKESSPEQIRGVYRNSYDLLFYLTLPLHSLIIVGARLISKLWIGHDNNIFIASTILVGIGYFLNALNAPAYHAFWGIGKARWNLIGTSTIALLNVCFGLLLGMLVGGLGVIVGWIIAVAMGGSIIGIAYHLENSIPLREMLPDSSRILTVICSMATAVALWVQYGSAIDFEGVGLDVLVTVLFLAVIAVPFVTHPISKRVMGQMSTETKRLRARTWRRFP